MAATSSDDDWKQRGVNVRMTKRRKVQLKELGRRLGVSESPHQVIATLIDHAYDHKADANVAEIVDAQVDADVDANLDANGATALAIHDRFDGLERGLASMEDRMAMLLERLGDSLAPLGALVAGEEAQVPTLGRWLAECEIETGQFIKKLALIRVRWKASDALDSASLSLRLRASLLNVDGQALRPFPEGDIQLTGVLATSPFARAIHGSFGEALIMTCQPVGRGKWSCAAFNALPNGSLGTQIETFNA